MGAGGSAAAIGGTGALSQVGKYAKMLSGAGDAIGSATNQAAQNRFLEGEQGITRAQLDDKERSQALHDLYSLNASMHPTSSPFNPRPIQAPTGATADTLNNLLTQNQTRLNTPSTYNATNLPSLQAGTLEKVGNWAAPAAKILGENPGVLSKIGSFVKGLF